jgi:hypothetical protein
VDQNFAGLTWIWTRHIKNSKHDGDMIWYDQKETNNILYMHTLYFPESEAK